MFSQLLQTEFKGAMDIIEKHFISICIVDNTLLLKVKFTK